MPENNSALNRLKQGEEQTRKYVDDMVHIYREIYDEYMASLPKINLAAAQIQKLEEAIEGIKANTAMLIANQNDLKEGASKIFTAMEALGEFNLYGIQVPRLEPLPQIEGQMVRELPKPVTQLAATNYLPLNPLVPNSPSMSGPTRVIELKDATHYWKNVRGQAQSFIQWTAIVDGHNIGWHRSSASHKVTNPRRTGEYMTLNMYTSRQRYKCTGCPRGVLPHEPYARLTEWNKINHDTGGKATEENRNAIGIYCRNCLEPKGRFRVQLLVPQNTSSAFTFNF